MLEVEVVKAGPFPARGAYAVAATLHTSAEPVPAAEGAVVSGVTAERTHAGGGEVR